MFDQKLWNCRRESCLWTWTPVFRLSAFIDIFLKKCHSSLSRRKINGSKSRARILPSCLPMSFMLANICMHGIEHCRNCDKSSCPVNFTEVREKILCPSCSQKEREVGEKNELASVLRNPANGRTSASSERKAGRWDCQERNGFVGFWQTSRQTRESESAVAMRRESVALLKSKVRLSWSCFAAFGHLPWLRRAAGVSIKRMSTRNAGIRKPRKRLRGFFCLHFCVIIR
jgi:hypothetical protein